ncbi:mechanosensitive ion channel domain-containing protein [uncultured Sunxiuqinia sp.]|uniref:mechanosensitive ion channel domain-containing protein n=1 Tax=uncultured Sunxiuqinia sp. TaxID=1573825 RepID=UPI0026076AB1|nr:mechanosensitive ion channel domain-containing protein [uncultured Sunxiuqinia sp.]
MKRLNRLLIVFVFILLGNSSYAQQDSITQHNDSVNSVLLQDFNQKLLEIEQLRLADSIRKVELEKELNSLKTTDNLKKEELQLQLQQIEEAEIQRINNKRARIDALRNSAIGAPVIGVLHDTLFHIYSKIGAFTPAERAENISKRIRQLYNDDFLKLDSISVVASENSYEIVYGETIVMSVTETDAFWTNQTTHDLALSHTDTIKQALSHAKKENSLIKILIRVGLVILVFIIARLIIWLIGRGYRRALRLIHQKKGTWLKSLSYRDYTFLSIEQEMQAILFLLKIVRWFLYVLMLYITLPLVFSIFPFTRGWADQLFKLVWSPFKAIFIAVWDYLPNLFSILVIYFVMKYFIRFVRYIFAEIESEKLKISGFHADWAMPTYSIVRFLLYAFMFVLIFPYLPGSDSNIFKGVSVFIGVLFSLGSSSAIANMIAGLVITYMRPFKIGDRIKIGEIFGDVVEKTLLVTRLKTIKNEIITIPNSTILSGNTINYSSEAVETGLIIHSTITIGYDVPWKEVHQALIDAALRTEHLLHEPSPFVLQTSLDDFFVSYQINAYTQVPTKQALIYSNLHQNIQDVCNEKGIEIMSPHYRAARDGNQSTIPADYLPKDYQTPSFRVKVDPAKGDRQ